MRFWTGAGDRGKTSVIGGKVVSKASDLIEAVGSVDELNAFIGLAKSFIKDGEVAGYLEEIQRQLFILGGDLASTLSDRETWGVPRIERRHVERLEEITVSVGGRLPPLRSFILPGGSVSASLLHVARTVCRRAERRVVALSESLDINPEAIRYLNRLSSTLFVLARYVNMVEGFGDVPFSADEDSVKADG